jgi:hypothetical protein
VLPIALLGAGAAMTGAGVALGLVGVNDASNAKTRDGAAEDQARSLALAGDILAGVGLATAAAGVVVLAVRSSRAPANAVSVQPWVGLGSAGIHLVF